MPRGGDVRGGRWGRVQRRRPYGVQRSQLTAPHGGPRRGEPGVEAALIADLDRHVTARERLEHLHALRHGAGDGLLAEDGHTGLDGGQDQVRVGVGRRRDHHTVHTGGEHGLRRVRDLGAEPLGGGLRGVRERVGDDERADGVESGEGLGVEGADAAEAEDSDTHVVRCSLLVVRGVRAGAGAPHAPVHRLSRRAWPARNCARSACGVHSSRSARRTTSACEGGARPSTGGSRSRLVGKGTPPRSRRPPAPATARPRPRPSAAAAPGRRRSPPPPGPRSPWPGRTRRRPAAGWPCGGCPRSGWYPLRGTARG